MDLGKYIYELLQSHECVVLPGLGGFITRKECASIHPVKNLFTPPTRTVIFNNQLVRNDGLLAQYIAQQESIDYEVALQSLMFYINEYLFSLYKGEKVELSQIGTLSILNDSINFEANTGLNIQEENYGLTSFMIPLVEHEKSIPQRIIQPAYTKEADSQKHIGRYVGIAASIVILLGCFSYFFIIQNPTSLNLSNVVPTIKSWFVTEKEVNPIDSKTLEIAIQESQEVDVNQNNDTELVQDEIQDVAIENEQEILPIVETIPENNIVNEDKVEPIVSSEETKQAQINENKTFYVIGASYEDRERAENRCIKVKKNGYAAEVLEAPKIGRFRVSYGSFSNRAEAETLLEEIRQTYRPDAWLLILKNQ